MVERLNGHEYITVTTKVVGKITILLCKLFLSQFFLVDLCSLQPRSYFSDSAKLLAIRRFIYTGNKITQYRQSDNMSELDFLKSIQREHFLSEVNNRETIAYIEANNDRYCLQNQIEKFTKDHKKN